MNLPSLMSLSRLSAITVLGILLAGSDVAGQAAMTDEGRFVLEREGQAFATDEFTIRNSGFGANQQIMASGTLEMVDGRETIQTTLLTEGPEFRVRFFQSTSTGTEGRRMEMTVNGDRFRAEISTKSRTQEREFRARIDGQSIAVLDPLLPHQYYFLGRLAVVGSETRLSVITPLDLVQSSATLTVVGTEELQIDGTTIASQHLRLAVGEVIHDVWIDLQNRVLRVAVPTLGIRALRGSAPPN